jgi:hypothetical protein
MEAFIHAGWDVSPPSLLRNVALARKWDEETDVAVVLDSPLRVDSAWGSPLGVALRCATAHAIARQAIDLFEMDSSSTRAGRLKRAEP